MTEEKVLEYINLLMDYLDDESDEEVAAAIECALYMLRERLL